MGKITDAILEAFEMFPNTSIEHIKDLVPSKSPHSMVSKLVTQGQLVKTHAGNRQYVYRRAEAGEAPKPKVVHPTAGGILAETQAEVISLRAELVELLNWKAEAIRRYPDLNVSQDVLDAREIVAEKLRATGDIAHATQVKAGAKDNSVLVAAVVEALSRKG